MTLITIGKLMTAQHPRRATVPCPNCGTAVIFDLCSKDFCPTCGQRFCCADQACLDRIDRDLWEEHQTVLLAQLHQAQASSTSSTMNHPEAQP